MNFVLSPAECVKGLSLKVSLYTIFVLLQVRNNYFVYYSKYKVKFQERLDLLDQPQTIASFTLIKDYVHTIVN